MKIWLIIVSVVVVLLAASTGVGFWMLTDAKAELSDAMTELTDAKAELADAMTEMTVTQEKLEENFGYWWDETAGESWWLKYSPWGEYLGGKKTAEKTIHDIDLSVEELEGTVQDLAWTVQTLQWTVRDLEDAVQDLEWQVLR